MEENENRFFVYMHINKINGKRYIGITGREKPEWRWGKEGKRYKDSRYFHNAIQKYGWNNFEHIILFEKLTLEQAKQKEIELIAKYKSNERPYGYNITAGGDNYTNLRGENNPRYGTHVSEETRRRMSEAQRKAQKEKIMSPESLKKLSESLKKYYQTHPAQIHIPTLEERRRMVKITNEYYKTHSASRTGQHLSEDSKKKIATGRLENGCAFAVRCLETGKTYISLREASKDTNVSRSSISDCCKHKTDSVKGYHFEYVNEENHKVKGNGKKKKIICIDTGKIYDSLADAARELGVDKNRIWASCQSDIKTARGLNFQYYNEE